MHIKAGEFGVVRLFSLDLPVAAARQFDHDALQFALGGAALDPGQTDLIDVSDLEGIGLTGYLRDGIGVSEAELDPLRGPLNALNGRVAVIRSAAFQGVDVTATATAPLRWIASFGEARLDLTAPPLTSSSAKGTLDAAVTPAPALHTKTLMWVLAALAFFALTTMSMLIRITA